MTSLKTMVAVAGLAVSVGFAGPAAALPANGTAPLAADHVQANDVQAGTALPVEHVQYYGYGYPCVFPYRCGFYGRGYYGGYYGRGFYGRGYYGRGYGRGFYGRGGFRR